ncbi:hypothetical protein [Phormidesmis priestleyi]
MPTRVLDSYYSANWAWWNNAKANEIQKAMQMMLTEQRSRWKQLLALQTENFLRLETCKIPGLASLAARH